MDQTIHEYFHDLRQDLLARAEVNSNFQLAEFMETVANELIDTGFVEGFEFCHFRAPRGMRVDGFWFDDEGGLTLFIADFDFRIELASLTPTEVTSSFKRLISFFEASCNKELWLDLEVTSPEYGLSRQIHDRKETIRHIDFILLSERLLSDKLQNIDSDEVCGKSASYHIWDISRLHRQHCSRGHKEPLNIDFLQLFGHGISCLPAHLGSEAYQSYLVVMSAEILAELYGKYGGRLLEQNVRSFLQARGSVNKGIRSTILTEPKMFFAYNNGITATAQHVETTQGPQGLQITAIRDLQIVNGGQTTASLFHTKRKDKAILRDIFVQMKLSVIDSADSETIVPKISEYANTQNRVNAADFFSNQPFYLKIAEFSRRLWAPAQAGSQRETKWFYERSRGQYADAQAKLTPAEQRKFKAENPKSQLITKTDLAKFENVWDEHPKYVNLGAQKNFSKYATRIAKEWAIDKESFNEFYFKRAIARGLIFRATEKLVSEQEWYNGGYRANIVAYTISCISYIAKRHGKAFDALTVWNQQTVSPSLLASLSVIAKFVNDSITKPPLGISNISEWCKKEACWTELESKIESIENSLPAEFWGHFISSSEEQSEKLDAKKIQKIDDGIAAQRRVLEFPVRTWSTLMVEGNKIGILTPKDQDIIKIASQIPNKIPSEKQCAVLISLIEKAKQEGLIV
jgi:hypothetical protein